MNLSSILGGTYIGKDTSGNLIPTFVGGVAVQTPDGWFVMKDSKMLDVSDLILTGTENYVYRIPVDIKNLKPGDLIIKSDNPLDVIFLQEVEKNGNIRGLDTTSEVVEYTPPINPLFKIRLYVKVISLIDGFGDGKDGNNFLPLLLLTNRGDLGTGGDALTTLVLLQALSGTALDTNRLLPFLLLSGTKSDGGLDSLLLLQALGGTQGLLGDMLSSDRKSPDTAAPGQSQGEGKQSQTRGKQTQSGEGPTGPSKPEGK